jgi:predicted nucleotidyltransferase
MYAFGSVVSGGFDVEKSDVDLIVELGIYAATREGRKVYFCYGVISKIFLNER